MAKQSTDETKDAAAADLPVSQVGPQATHYQYVGDVISSQAIGGQTVTLAPGKIVTLPSDDPVVARLLKQGRLVPYTLRQPQRG